MNSRPLPGRGQPSVLAVLLGMLVLTLNSCLSNSTDSIEVVREWIEHHEAGDVEGFQALMAEDATYLCTFEGVLFCGEPERYFGGSVSADASDARESRLIYVADGSLGADCSADGSEVTCAFERTNLFHEIDGLGPTQYTYVFTVEDGIITAVVHRQDSAVQPNPDLGQYRLWVQARYPDQYEELFFTTTMLLETRDRMERHRELIAEWAAGVDS